MHVHTQAQLCQSLKLALICSQRSDVELGENQELAILVAHWIMKLSLFIFSLQALRMILQLGVKPSWFNTCIATKDMSPYQIPVASSNTGDLRSYMIDSLLPPIGDSVVPELLLKVLEPYRREGGFFLFFYLL